MKPSLADSSSIQRAWLVSNGLHLRFYEARLWTVCLHASKQPQASRHEPWLRSNTDNQSYWKCAACSVLRTKWHANVAEHAWNWKQYNTITNRFRAPCYILNFSKCRGPEGGTGHPTYNRYMVCKIRIWLKGTVLLVCKEGK